MTLFLPQTGTCILHIPRTGGTFIRAAMHALQIPFEDWDRSASRWRPRKHTPLSFMISERQRRVRFVVAFVRDPVEYYSAMWRYSISRLHKTNAPSFRRYHPMHFHSLDENTDWSNEQFNRWVLDVVKNDPATVTRLFELFVGPKNCEVAHFIGRLETVVDDLEQLLSLIGHRKQWRRRGRFVRRMEKRNESQQPPFAMHPEVAESVRAVEAAWMRFYGTEEAFQQRLYGALQYPAGWKIKSESGLVSELAYRLNGYETPRLDMPANKGVARYLRRARKRDRCIAWMPKEVLNDRY